MTTPASVLHYPQDSYQLQGIIGHSDAYDIPVGVYICTPDNPNLLPVDELRLIHQALLDAAAEIHDQMAYIASAAWAARARETA